MKIKSLFSKFKVINCFCFSSITSSQTIYKECATKINQSFTRVDKSKVPHGILKDYAMEFTESTAHNGKLTASNHVIKGTFSNLYKMLLMARVTANIPSLIAPDLYKHGTAKEKSINSF